MKPRRILFTVAILALIYLLAGACQSASAATKPKPPPPVDPRKLIKSVNVPNNIVVIQFMRDKTLHTYTIDDLTTLKVNGVAGKIADIKPGMVVDDFMERTDTALDSLTLSGYGDASAAAKPKAKPPAKPKTPPPPQT